MGISRSFSKSFMFLRLMRIFLCVLLIQYLLHDHFGCRKFGLWEILWAHGNLTFMITINQIVLWSWFLVIFHSAQYFLVILFSSSHLIEFLFKPVLYAIYKQNFQDLRAVFFHMKLQVNIVGIKQPCFYLGGIIYLYFWKRKCKCAVFPAM